KVQFVVGTLASSHTFTPTTVTLSNLLTIDASVQRTLRDVIKKEMLLEFSFENVLDLIAATSPGGGGGVVPFTCGCSIATIGGAFAVPAGLTVTISTGTLLTVAGGTLNAGICTSCAAGNSFLNLSLALALGVGATLNIGAADITSVACSAGTLTITGTGTVTVDALPPATGTFTISFNSTTGVVDVSVTSGATTLLAVTIPGVPLTFATC
ncbi:TPA: hypothetical protein ROX88_001284, partial [Bacillus pseudomycoides]|nr:hypothetical protein [Bacillus pseudomycoides]